MHEKSGISIWFFIGISLTVNGALILGAGIYQLIYPPQYRVVLYQFHASIWWGALLFLAGIAYCYVYSPARERARLHAASGTQEHRRIHDR